MRRKNAKIITILLASIMPEIVFATDYIICDTDKKFPLVFAQMTSTFMTIIKIFVPILLVISGMISFLKVTFSGKVEDELKKAKSKLVNSIIAAVVIFFIFSIVNFAVSLVAGANNKFMSCVNCFINSDKCAIEKDNGEKICPGFINDQTKYDDDCKPIKTETNKANTSTPNTQQVSTTKKTNGTSSLAKVGNDVVLKLHEIDKTLDNFVFIGDSRYEGIKNQLEALGKNINVTALKTTGPTYWLNNMSKIPNNALKISVMLGVNETSVAQMQNFLTKLHEKNPNAIIYVNSVYHVGTKYTAGYVNNTTIDNFNEGMKQFCSANNWLKYIDVTSNLHDNNGNLNDGYTPDGLHMNQTGNNILVNNIKTELTK